MCEVDTLLCVSVSGLFLRYYARDIFSNPFYSFVFKFKPIQMDAYQDKYYTITKETFLRDFR